jgi:hypothetical protein
MFERVVSWALAVALSVLLLFIAYQQLLGPTPSPVFGLVAMRSGVALFEPWARYATALAEIAAIVLLLWPRMRIRGAVLALAIAVVAIAFHLTPWLGIAVPRADAVAQAAAQGRTAAEIFAMQLPTDKGAMFLLALVVAILSAVTVAVERANRYAAAHKTKRPVGAFA